MPAKLHKNIYDNYMTKGRGHYPYNRNQKKPKEKEPKNRNKKKVTNGGEIIRTNGGCIALTLVALRSLP